MRVGIIHLYVSAVAAAAVYCLSVLQWAELAAFPTDSLVGFAVLVVLGLVFEASAFSHRVGHQGGSSSLVFLPLLACVLLFGPAAAVLLLAVTGLVAEVLIRRKDRLRATFNISQYVVATTLAGWAFSGAGGLPVGVLVEQGIDIAFDTQIFAFVLFVIVFLVLNHLQVSLAIAISQKRSVRQVMGAVFANSAITLLHDVLVAPIALLVAFLYLELQPSILGLLVGLFPLVFIRYSYLAKHRLEEANRDLLTVLVKAIETRDPYTSGHSMRVQVLATEIAEALGLPARRVEEIKTAALLHDIGKIEVVYEEILQKPGALSDEERKVIESHVTRGVEILTSLSSFSPGVIAAVRHHHEAYDGSGYPDGLQGEAIPLGARIIHVCDAIDAMLSDRAYRRALSAPVVRAELKKCQGSQFDPRIVDVLLDSDLVERHNDSMDLNRRLEGAAYRTRIEGLEEARFVQ